MVNSTKTTTTSFSSSLPSSNYRSYFRHIFLSFGLKFVQNFFSCHSFKVCYFRNNSIKMMNIGLKWMVNIYAYISAICKKTRTFPLIFFLCIYSLWQIDYSFLIFIFIFIRFRVWSIFSLYPLSNSSYLFR